MITTSKKSLRKGYTFRTLFNHFTRISVISISFDQEKDRAAWVGRKVAKGLENIQIRRGELILSKTIKI